jgi:hypothetical protein
MTITKTIEMARTMLKVGNGSAYARVLSGCIRAAGPHGIANTKYRAAIAEDKAEALFVDLDTRCPLAA